MNQSERRIWLIKYLLGENKNYKSVEIPSDSREQFDLYRALVNVRMPEPISGEYLEVEDEFLKEEIRIKGTTALSDLTPLDGGLYLWQGDITLLECDAIVNAANSQLLGCFAPCHACIDNCIHTFSGVRLRLKCNEIMRAQGKNEPTGRAKITPAYNLPSKCVIHTVGPIVNSVVTPRDRALLSSCYLECLRLAEENGLESIAFCCISTGVFGYPKSEAAEVAVKTVKKYKAETNSRIKVIFNVFKNADLEIYKKLLGG